MSPTITGQHTFSFIAKSVSRGIYRLISAWFMFLVTRPQSTAITSIHKQCFIQLDYRIRAYILVCLSF